jgi:hypothetical protein
MTATSSLPDNDPHAYPSVYEPDPPPSPSDNNAAPEESFLENAPIDANSDSMLGSTSTRGNAGEKVAVVKGKMALNVRPGGNQRPSDAQMARAPATPKRAYGRKDTSTGTSVGKFMPHPKDLDFFPAFMSRSPLFGAFRSNCGGTHAGPLKAPKDVSLMFNGPRLSMADKRVWEAIIRIAKRDSVDISQPFEIGHAEVARMAGYADGQSRSAEAAIGRLAQSNLVATVGHAKMVGGFLSAATPVGPRRSMIRLDLALVEPAFSQTLLASMSGACNDGVKSILGQWLRDYFCTHEPMDKDFTLDYLLELSGFPSAPKHFVTALEKALDELKTKRPDLVEDWSILKENDGNASGRWKLRLKRGPAAPVVKHPAKPSLPIALAQTFPKKRGGVAL